jgi:hypothetical protein
MTETTSPPAVWIDGHPQLEAIAAAVYEQCGRSDSGLTIDDPRNIAVAALAAATTPPAAPLSVAVLARVLADAAHETSPIACPAWDQLDAAGIERFRAMAGLVIGRLGGGAGAERATLRDRIAGALAAEFTREGGVTDGMRVLDDSDLPAARRPRPLEIADAVLAELLGPIPAGIDVASWTAIRAIQLMNEAGREAEERRMALSQTLGLGTGAPWDAICERAAELQPAPESAP